MAKERIDKLLVKLGFYPTQHKAQRAIMAGLVFVNKERIEKAGTPISTDANIVLKEKPHPYVSRGGLKLAESIQVFALSLQGKIVVDIGASTGGFTDCALQHGAKQVYAVDVGYGLLDWKLRQDPRVVVLERTNFRYIEAERLAHPRPQIATIDVSFISLKHILLPLYPLLTDNGEVVALIKPQFEAPKDQVGKKGIVRDPEVHYQVLQKVQQLAEQAGFVLTALAPSPIQGGAGNIEFLSYMHKNDTASVSISNQKMEQVVEEAQKRFLLR